VAGWRALGLSRRLQPLLARAAAGADEEFLAGYFFVGAAGGFAFDLLQLNASRVGGGLFWPVLVGTGAATLRAAGIKRARLIPLLLLLVVVTRSPGAKTHFNV
jgi:hypothetical protein